MIRDIKLFDKKEIFRFIINKRNAKEEKQICLVDMFEDVYFLEWHAAHLCFDHDLASFPISGSEIPEYEGEHSFSNPDPNTQKLGCARKWLYPRKLAIHCPSLRYLL